MLRGDAAGQSERAVSQAARGREREKLSGKHFHS